METLKYKRLLENKEAELVAALRRREGITIPGAPDALDKTQFTQESELIIRSLDREFSLLREVRRALGRIKDGSYGTCLHCEEDIKPKRLDAIPWAEHCIRCQQAADNSGYANEALAEEFADVA